MTVVGFLDGVGIVFDDEHGVAEIAQGFEDVDEALRIARMQADGRLVENVERADEMRAERSRELDALRFAAGKRRGEALEREVVEADFVEKLQARANFVENFVGDFRLRRRELQRAEEDARFFDGELADFGDGFAGDPYRASFGTQARAAAIGASSVSAIAAQEHADVELVFFALEIIEEAFDAVEFARGIAFEQQACAGRL